MKKILISLFLVFLTAASAYAVPVTYNFSGYIDSVQIYDTSSTVGSTVNNIVAGTSTFSGTISYDTLATATVSGSSYAIYPGIDFSITIDSVYSFSADAPEAFVLDPFDRFSMQETSSVTSDIIADYMFFALTDASKAALNGTSLPTSMELANLLDLNGWDGIIISNDSPSGLGSTSQSYIVSGPITSITPVPEASTLLLFAMGLTGMVVIMGIKSKRWEA